MKNKTNDGVLNNFITDRKSVKYSHLTKNWAW